jgi:hypothetical protein
MGLLSGLGNFVGSIFGGSSGAPSRQVTELDQTTKGLIDEYAARGQRPEEEITKEGYGLADEAAAQVSSPSNIGGYSPMMGDAIRMKYNEAAQRDMGKLKLQSEMQGRLDKAQQMRTGWEMFMAKQNIATQNFAKAAEAKMQSEALRAQVLSSIFGAAGTVAGIGLQKGWFKGNSMDHGGWGGDMSPLPHELQWQNEVAQQKNIASLAPGQSNVGGY